MNKNVDVTKNIRMIEWLKSELLTATALLFKTLVMGINNSQEKILDILANVILITYLLGRRFGLTYENIDTRIKDKAKIGQVEEHEIEKSHGDLSELIRHLNRKI